MWSILILIGALLSAVGSSIVLCTQEKHKLYAAIILFGAILSIVGNFVKGNESASLITGGDSFCYVLVQAGDGGDGWISNPNVKCEGKFPAYDVSVLLYDPDTFGDDMSQEDFLNNSLQLEVGTVWPNGFKMFGESRKARFTRKDIKFLQAHITTRNRLLVEDLLFKKISNNWLRAIRLYEGKPNGVKGNLVHEWADQDFPRDQNGKILWD